MNNEDNTDTLKASLARLHQPTHLGDGLYAVMENGDIKLYTGSMLNVVYLDPKVLREFLRWLGVQR